MFREEVRKESRWRKVWGKGDLVFSIGLVVFGIIEDYSRGEFGGLIKSLVLRKLSGWLLSGFV